MEIRQVTDNLALAGQISLQDFEQLVAHGFKTFINNRPDGEGVDQPPRNEFEAKAQALGVAYHYLPLNAGTPPSVELAQQFKAVLSKAEGPVLAYCRSGNRSGMIAQLAFSLPD